ncbi:MAG: hypothetical protein P1U34_09580 [Coxiellaceae bacterium]|nr:hypothetical protein [Coxiellaceae bacterium]
MRTSLIVLMSAAMSLTTITAFANSPITFNTPEQASKYCPALDQLTYKPASAAVIKKGKITGTKNGKTFTSVSVDGSGYVGRPKTLYANNTVGNVNYRQVMGAYGRIVNGRITCLDSYETFNGVSLALVLASN